MTGALVVAGFGFGLCLAGGFVGDGLAGPWTAYWIGGVLLVGALSAALTLGARRLRHETENRDKP